MSRKVERSYGLHDTRLEDFEGEVREEDFEQDGGESLLLEELFVTDATAEEMNSQRRGVETAATDEDRPSTTTVAVAKALPDKAAAIDEQRRAKVLRLLAAVAQEQEARKKQEKSLTDLQQIHKVAGSISCEFEGFEPARLLMTKRPAPIKKSNSLTFGLGTKTGPFAKISGVR